MMDSLTGYMRITSVAKDIGVHERTVRDWIKKGLICYRPSQRLVLIKRSDLDKFMKKFKVKKTDIDDLVESVMKDLVQ